MSSLYFPLNESFDNITGSIGPSGYVTFSGATPVSMINTYESHYNLRTFKLNKYTTPLTMADLNWHNVGYLGGSGVANNFTVGQLQTSFLSGNSNTSLENWILTTSGVGGKTLTGTPTTIPVGANSITTWLGPDPQYYYSDVLSVTMSGTNPSGTWASTYTDNIINGFNSFGQTYNINMVVRNAPAQNASLTLNLAQSFIDITSNNYLPSATDTIPFSQFTTISSTTTKDTFMQFNRSQLVNSNLSNISGIRFRLTSKGSGVFTTKFQDMQVYPTSIYDFPTARVNTQTKRFEGGIGISGTVYNPNSPVVFGQQAIWLYPSAPKNFTQNVRFNTGNFLATVSGTNAFHLYYRYFTDSSTFKVSYLRNDVSITNGTTSVAFLQLLSGSVNPSTLGSFSATLSGSTDYILRTSVVDNNAQVSLYNTDGAFLGSRVNTTGNLVLSASTSKGFTGWSFQPVNYDFNLDEIIMERAEFGTMTTNPILSFKPIVGAKLTANTSAPITLLNTTNFVAYGDAATSSNAQGGLPPPDIIVTRSGTLNNNVPTSSWYGGVISSGTYFIGDPNELYLAGSIFPYTLGFSNTTYSGTFQVGLLNKHNLVGYVHTIPNVVGGQWNNFVLPLNPKLVSGKYSVVIRNAGFYPTAFEVDNLAIYHNTISWSASDDGVNYQPFYDNINDEYAILTFSSQNKQIQLKGASLSNTNNWIESYILTPIYEE